MYYYLYDTFLQEQKYEKSLDLIKTRLLDLEIQGKNEKLTLLKSIDELINDEVKRGVTTVVVVGNDKTFLKAIDAVAKNNITLGIIPVGSDNNIASFLGIGSELDACEILSSRKVVKVDLGKVNGQYFFNKVSIDKNLERISVEKDKIKIIPRSGCGLVEINNFYLPTEQEKIDKRLLRLSPQDGVLEMLIYQKEKKKSWFLSKAKNDLFLDSLISAENFKVKSFEYLPVLVDGFRVLKTPLDIIVEKKQLSLIVGKNRLINID